VPWRRPLGDPSGEGRGCRSARPRRTTTGDGRGPAQPGDHAQNGLGFRQERELRTSAEQLGLNSRYADEIRREAGVERLQQLSFPEGVAYDGDRFNQTVTTWCGGIDLHRDGA
jgi:hypothetical protein